MMVCKPLILLFVPFFLFAQAANTESKPAETYEKNREYQKKMRFQKLWKDYVVFYDDDRRLFYLKYRQDRWDYHNDEKIRGLVNSVEYNTSFIYTGPAFHENEILNSPETLTGLPGERPVRTIKSIFYGNYKNHNFTQIDMIRY